MLRSKLICLLSIFLFVSTAQAESLSCKELSFRRVHDGTPGDTSLYIPLSPIGGRYGSETYWVENEVLLDASIIEQSTIKTSERKFPTELMERIKREHPNEEIRFASKPTASIVIMLKQENPSRFYQMTKENVGSRIALVLNDKLLMAPFIREPIDGNEIHVTGAFSVNEAEQINQRINSLNQCE
jgi:hypothetical protein